LNFLRNHFLKKKMHFLLHDVSLEALLRQDDELPQVTPLAATESVSLLEKQQQQIRDTIRRSHRDTIFVPQHPAQSLVTGFTQYCECKTLPCTTTHRCFWDHHPFETMPLTAPIRCEYVETKERNLTGRIAPVLRCVIGEGIFCGFTCALAYVREKKKIDPRRWRQSELILLRMFTQVHAATLRSWDATAIFQRLAPAPFFCMLDVYGGSMSIERYRAECGEYAYVPSANYTNNLIPMRLEAEIFLRNRL
jgi:hypothetical protein